MAKWREVKLGEIAYVNMGQSPKSEFFNQTGEGMKFLQGNRTFGRMFPSYDTYTTDITKTADDGDILFTVRAPVGNINLASTKVCIGRGIASIRSKQNQMFLFYYLKSNVDLIRSAENGTTYSSVNRKDLEQFKLYIPDLPTQEKIAKLLFIYDRLIENNNRRIKLLEQAAEELYKEWFVRMRFPGHENTKFVNRIPEGWQVKRLGDVCRVTDGTHDTPKPVEYGVPLITGKNIMNSTIDFSTSYNISKNDHELIKRRSGLKTGDILFSNIGSIGNSCIVDYDREFSVKNVIILKPNSEKEMVFLYYWITNNTTQSMFQNQTNGASQQFIGLTFMRKFKLLVPKIEVLDAFEQKISSIVKHIQLLKRKNQNLIKQRDLLLPRLMSGKMEV